MLVLTIPTLLIASQNTLIADYSGKEVFSNDPILINSTLNATEIHVNPDTVYIVVMAGDPLYTELTNMLGETVGKYGLKPVVVSMPSERDELTKFQFQFRGRVIAVYVRSKGKSLACYQKPIGSTSWSITPPSVIYKAF
ncbi:hypothetical protein [Thermococcus piezophilus]|uniref:hypothetical protein n=1 Tax=Thermococcus piezophilus TaxID=1712654 RepID=UPI001901C987|nr:hypothetical protein [Thermococcus piezophilus]